MLRGKENGLGEEALSYIALDTNRQRLEVVTFTENPQTYYDTDVPEEKSSFKYFKYHVKRRLDLFFIPDQRGIVQRGNRCH